MRPLTEKQEQTLSYIRTYVRKHGYPPSRPEIAGAIGVKHASTVDWHLTALTKKGWIEMRPQTPRAIRLLKEDVPVVPAGRIAAGEPVLAEGRILERIPMTVARRFTPHAKYFLEVHGDSMNRLGLNDGDLVAIHATPEAQNGDVVVARIDGEVTLKRYKRLDDGTIELHPESINERPRASHGRAGSSRFPYRRNHGRRGDLQRDASKREQPRVRRGCRLEAVNHESSR